jgi:hypothetical protein
LISLIDGLGEGDEYGREKICTVADDDGEYNRFEFLSKPGRDSADAENNAIETISISTQNNPLSITMKSI